MRPFLTVTILALCIPTASAAPIKGHGELDLPEVVDLPECIYTPVGCVGQCILSPCEVGIDKGPAKFGVEVKDGKVEFYFELLP